MKKNRSRQTSKILTNTLVTIQVLALVATFIFTLKNKENLIKFSLLPLTLSFGLNLVVQKEIIKENIREIYYRFNKEDLEDIDLLFNYYQKLEEETRN